MVSDHYNQTSNCLNINCERDIMANFEEYISPFSWRYGSSEMREIWGELHKRKIWRRLWVALAEVQLEFGLVQKDQVQDLITHMENVDIPRALEIESRIHHDLMAEVKTYAEQCQIGGGIIHLGCTSVDIKDNAIAIQVREALDSILLQLKDLLIKFAHLLEQQADTPLIGFTHLQPAEPSTLGYRFAQYAQDLLNDWKEINKHREDFKGKGFKGAVGTSASYSELIGVENLARFEELLSNKLALPFFEITTQTYPRKQDYQVVSALASLGASINKFAFDLRILQSPSFGEVAEPFGESQVGSSAMPFKRNPVHAEKINSLARMLAQFPRIAWDNAAQTLLERTLDDSANRRSLLPEAFLIGDELLRVTDNIIDGLVINLDKINQNLINYGPFAATERVLMALGKSGASRQEMHHLLRNHSLVAWESIQQGQPNPLSELISNDPIFQRYIAKSDLLNLMDSNQYTGNAAEKARELASKILNIV